MSRPRGTWARRLRRIAGRVALVFLGLVVCGACYQQISQALDRRAVAPPGRIVTVDGVDMHLHCVGVGGPTVILEAGAYGFSQVWAWVSPKLAERRRVCSYDRAGLGWSAEATGHDGEATVRRLRALLAAAGEPGPYALVGHSFGGALIRVFAERHPDEVVALGFIEPTHPDQLDRLPSAARAAHERVARVLRVLPFFAHVGLLRITNVIGRLYVGLPDEAYRAARMFASSPVHLRTTAAEMAAWESTMAAARANRTLGERPVVVVGATEALEGMTPDVLAANQTMNVEFAALSTRGRSTMVPGSDHMSLLTKREHAEQVAELLEETLAVLDAGESSTRPPP